MRTAVTNSGVRVLDIGCGTGFGYALCKAANLQVRYTGVDIAPEMLRIARQRFPDGTFVCCDGGQLQLPEGNDQFDVLLMLNGVLSFVANAEEALGRASSLIRHGGSVLVSGLSRYSLRRLLHARVGRYEAFATRGATSSSERTRARGFVRSELRAVLRQAHIHAHEVRGVGVLAGVLQFPGLWHLDQVLSHLFPNQSHLLWAVGTRA